MKKLLYIDVDGVILGWKDISNAEVVLAKHTKEFLEFCLSKYQCFWLTTNSRDGNSEGLMRLLSRYADNDTMEMIRAIPPSKWETFKTEAIDLNSDFYWVEDQLLAHEIKQLKAHSAYKRWIRIDTREDPEGLKKAI